MSRHPKTNFRAIRSRRDGALRRPELRQPSEPRAPADGPTSYPVKAVDPALKAMIEEALRRKASA